MLLSQIFGLAKHCLVYSNYEHIQRIFQHECNLQQYQLALLRFSTSIPETWFSNTELQNNSNLSLTGFDSVACERSKTNRGGGVIKKNLSYKIRKDL